MPSEKKGQSQDSNEAKGKISSFLGIASGVFGAVCPACLGINFLLFGNVFTAQLAFLIPYIFWVQVGGIVFLLFGLYFVAKSSYEKECLVCNIKKTRKTSLTTKDSRVFNKPIALILLGAAVVLLVIQVLFVFGNKTLGLAEKNKTENKLVTINGKKINIDKALKKATEEVTPQKGFSTKVKWGGVVSKMVKEGVLDPSKLESILKKRYGQDMKPAWREVLAGKMQIWRLTQIMQYL